jgi:hypothetical protein
LNTQREKTGTHVQILLRIGGEGGSQLGSLEGFSGEAAFEPGLEVQEMVGTKAWLSR